MSIEKEIEAMAAQMADKTEDFQIQSLEQVILELGPDGLKKALPTLSETQAELLKSTVAEMVAKGVEGLDSVIQTTEEGEMEWNTGKMEQSEQDELIADEARKRMASVRNQGGVPVEGWQGQIIGEGEAEMSMDDPSDLKVPDIMKSSKKEEDMEEVAEEAVEEHEEKMHKKDKKMAKSVAKENFIALVTRMQERKLEKSKCIEVLVSHTGASEALVKSAWEEIAKSYAEAKMDLDAKVMMAEKAQSEMPEHMEKEVKGKKDIPAEASVPAPRTDISREGAEMEERMKGGKSAQTADEGEMPPSTMKKAKENWDEVPGVNKYENEKKQKEDKETDIGGMSTTTADEGEMPPKTMKKSESFWHEEEMVYAPPAQDVFKSNSFGKNANYSVDAYIEAEEAALAENLSKSNFLYPSLEKAMSCGSAMKSMYKAGMSKEMLMKEMAKAGHSYSSEEMEKAWEEMSKMYKSENYIEAGLDMSASDLVIAETNRKAQAQGGFLVKSFADEEMDALFKSQDMWTEEDLEKAEGSRGGKVIGHTRSGKPIYDSAKHPAHSSFTKKDHNDAAKIHSDKSLDYAITPPGGNSSEERRKMSDHHYSKELEHKEAAKTAPSEKPRATPKPRPKATPSEKKDAPSYEKPTNIPKHHEKALDKLASGGDNHAKAVQDYKNGKISKDDLADHAEDWNWHKEAAALRDTTPNRKFRIVKALMENYPNLTKSQIAEILDEVETDSLGKSEEVYDLDLEKGA